MDSDKEKGSSARHDAKTSSTTILSERSCRDHGPTMATYDTGLARYEAELDRCFRENKDRLFREHKGRIWSSKEEEERPSTNPFSSFKRLVDEGISALATSFTNLPSNIDTLHQQMQQEQKRMKEEEWDISRRWTGNADSPDQIQMELQRSTPEEKQNAQSFTRMLLAESIRQNHDIPFSRIARLFKDDEASVGELDRFAYPMLSFGGACYYMPEAGENLPSTAATMWRWPTLCPRWLSIDWFKRSPYSPISLEAHPDMEEAGAQWRAAFEDLMCASLGKPMTSKEQFGVRDPPGRPQSTYFCPGLDWMLSLQCRGILPPLLPRTYNSRIAANIQRPREIIGLLAQNSSSLPWWSDSGPERSSPIEADLAELISEVGTKATSPNEDARGDVGREPWTELDLYESVARTPTAARHFSEPADTTTTQIQHQLGDRFSKPQAKQENLAYKSGSHDQAILQELSKVFENVTGESLTEDLGRKARSQNPKDSHSSEYPVDDEEPYRESQLPASMASSNSAILSALTTTETTRLPDGTVTTKVVLRQRFADGREHISESHHTYREGAEQRDQEDESSKGSSGWFWR